MLLFLHGLAATAQTYARILPNILEGAVFPESLGGSMGRKLFLVGGGWEAGEGEVGREWKEVLPE